MKRDNFNYSQADIIDFLESRISMIGELTDEEYGLFLDYKIYGESVFNDPKRTHVIRVLKIKMLEEFESEYVRVKRKVRSDEWD